MGINFKGSKATWSYHGFMHFRRRLAAGIGIDLDEMKGFTSKKSAVSWDTVTDDIKPLLNHSDCDGEMTPRECARVAPRLRELIEDWEITECYDRRHGLILADTMEKCAQWGDALEFC